MEILPIDIVLEILDLLEHDDLIRCMRVAKPSNILIQHGIFDKRVFRSQAAISNHELVDPFQTVMNPAFARMRYSRPQDLRDVKLGKETSLLDLFAVERMATESPVTKVTMIHTSDIPYDVWPDHTVVENIHRVTVLDVTRALCNQYSDDFDNEFAEFQRFSIRTKNRCLKGVVITENWSY